MQSTYTLAIRQSYADAFQAVQGIPKNMTLKQANTMAVMARSNGLDVVAINTESE